VKGVGGKFANSVYAMMIIDSEPTLVNFQFYGASLSPFIDFQKENDIYKNSVNITGSTPAKKGATNYFIPIFESGGITEEESKVADLMDIELQKYVDDYKLGQIDKVEKDDWTPDASTKPEEE